MKKLIQKHHNLAYIISRLKQIIFQKKNPSAPWLTKDSISLLDELIKDSDIGLEFGSGRSTKWFARRCKYLYSIEHNQKWYNTVKEQIKDFENVSYFFAPINKDNKKDSEYLNQVKELKNQSVDFILNDGKIRAHVAIYSLNKLRSGGLYILDNAERYINNSFLIPESIGTAPANMLEEWKAFVSNTVNWRKIWTTDGVSSTLILFKP